MKINDECKAIEVIDSEFQGFLLILPKVLPKYAEKPESLGIVKK